MTLKNPITREQAQAGGYRLLTTDYAPNERWMLEEVVRDMERGGIDYVLVGVLRLGNYFCAVARRGMQRLSGRESDMTGRAA